MFNTPILYIIFNRLDTVKQTFPKIKEQKPKQLFIAADGPRVDRVGEFNKCKEVREWVLNQIDWECDLHTLFRDENLGCGKGPAEAITWFFDNVEQGIILEDDCLPVKSFFTFCEELLDYYKTDKRIMQISGTNRLNHCSNDNKSYFFTNYPSEWGWATWKRSWNLYDFSIKQWDNNSSKQIIRDVFYDEYKYNCISKILDQTINNNEVTWWDYQWGFIKNINSGLTVTPCINLISNIGFSVDASHTFDKNSPFYNIPSEDICFPLIKPKEVYKTVILDKKMFEINFGIPSKKNNMIQNIVNKLKRGIKKIDKYKK